MLLGRRVIGRMCNAFPTASVVPYTQYGRAPLPLCLSVRPFTTTNSSPPPTDKKNATKGAKAKSKAKGKQSDELSPAASASGGVPSNDEAAIRSGEGAGEGGEKEKKRVGRPKKWSPETDPDFDNFTVVLPPPNPQHEGK